MSIPSNFTGRTAFDDAEQYALVVLNIASRTSLDAIPRERLYRDQLAISCSRAIRNDGTVLPVELHLRTKSILVVVAQTGLPGHLRRALPWVLEEARLYTLPVIRYLGRCATALF